MTTNELTKIVASSLALAAFSIATLAGLSSDNPAHVVLSRALVSMLVCYPVGWAMGFVMARAAEHAVIRRRAENPLPENAEQIAQKFNAAKLERKEKNAKKQQQPGKSIAA